MNPNIAVQIKQAFLTVNVIEVRPFAPPHHKIQAVFLKKVRLAPRRVLSESRKAPGLKY